MCGELLIFQRNQQFATHRLVNRTVALKSLLAANSREAERLRRPVDAVWEALRASGIFYHFVPKIYGGLEFGVDAFIDAMLPLAEGCSSTGWVASFCVEHNWMLAHFSKELQDETFGAGFPYIIAPGVTFPPGIVTPVAGGYRVTGQWKWGTGVMHADWILAAAMLPNGPRPHLYFIAVPAEQAIVVDTWHMDGMIGTGSNDVVMCERLRARASRHRYEGDAGRHHAGLQAARESCVQDTDAAISGRRRGDSGGRCGTAGGSSVSRAALQTRDPGHRDQPERKARRPDAAGQSARAHDYSRDDDPAGGERELRAGGNSRARKGRPSHRAAMPYRLRRQIRARGGADPIGGRRR